MDDDVPMDPPGFYDEYGEREWERLDRDFHHRLEFEETVHFLQRDLPASGRVLDVGGGAGRYAVWLAERGYDVRLVDPSERQVELAREKAGTNGVADRVRAGVGDVRNLPYDAGTFDATLCLGGPLSHVLDADERVGAAEELRRVTDTSGPVFVSVIGLLASLQRLARWSGRLPDGEDETVLLPDLARTGDYDQVLVDEYDVEPTMMAMHLFRADEFETLLENAGLTVEALTGLEGVASQRRRDLEALDEDHRAAIRETVSELRADRGVADLSGHMLAVARA
jgi:SAM-dependent methyltransferase